MLYICPSRGRPNNVARLWNSWNQTRDHSQLLIALDEDDPELLNYHHAMAGVHDRDFSMEVRPRMRLGGTLNYWANEKAKDHDIIGFCGDDHLFVTPGWDTRIKSAMDSMGGTGVVYGNDLIQGPNLPTAVAISSNIIQTLGYMVPPGMVHLWIDNAWKLMGESAERLAYLGDVIIEHVHPAAGKAEWDAGYVEVNSGAVWDADEKTYKEWAEDGSFRPILRKLVGG